MTHKKGENNVVCPLDWADLFGRIGDEAIIAEFADSFLKNGETLVLSLKSAVRAHNLEQIELYAHALKGSASNMGAISLAKAAWLLEKSAAEKNLNDATEMLRAIEQEYVYLASLLEQPNWIACAKQAAAANVS